MCICFTGFMINWYRLIIFILYSRVCVSQCVGVHFKTVCIDCTYWLMLTSVSASCNKKYGNFQNMIVHQLIVNTNIFMIKRIASHLKYVCHYWLLVMSCVSVLVEQSSILFSLKGRAKTPVCLLFNLSQNM